MQSTNLILALSQSNEINTNLGLNYFNHNISLYIKILNSFVARYQYLNLIEMNEEERNMTLHSLKGLTSTLGMEQLTYLILELEKSFTPLLIEEFKERLELTILTIDKIKN